MADFPFEIHISVRGVKNPATFMSDCRELGVKPIIINLQDRVGETVMCDVMTSSRIKTNTFEALHAMKRLSMRLEDLGYTVVREKLETTTDHPLAYNEGLRRLPYGRHFEARFPVLLPVEFRPVLRGFLQEIAFARYCHLSRNAFKVRSDGQEVVMLTFRDYWTNTVRFREVCSGIKGYLTWANFKLDEDPEIEFCVYDSNKDHDEAWLKA